MSNFRIKKTPKIQHNMKDSNTLEIKHRRKIEQIEVKKKSLEKLNQHLIKVNDDLFKIDKQRELNGVFDLEKRAELLNQKKKIEEEISNINNNMDEINYYDLTGDLLSEYYTIRETKQTTEIKNILEYLKPNSNAKKQTGVTKAALFDKFCQRIDGVRVNKDDGTNRIKYCTECGVEKTLVVEESSYICPECGEMEFVIIDEDRQIKEYSPYKRINHFKEWLNQLQAKEITEITPDIFENIVGELNKYKNSDLASIGRDKMQDILKKLGYNKLYEHIPFILNKLIGVDPPKIDRETEDKFIEMFTIIQEPWEHHKPKGRKNFLSYPYILYKFSELLEKDDLLSFFPMLQPQKLMEQDLIWQKFCKHLKWEYYPTV
jgi:predicted RNA-binding Zn-ribbon protein involved in translation (DUF1610 family)